MSKFLPDCLFLCKCKLWCFCGKKILDQRSALCSWKISLHSQFLYPASRSEDRGLMNSPASVRQSVWVYPGYIIKKFRSRKSAPRPPLRWLMVDPLLSMWGTLQLHAHWLIEIQRPMDISMSKISKKIFAAWSPFNSNYAANGISEKSNAVPMICLLGSIFPLLPSAPQIVVHIRLRCFHLPPRLWYI